MFRMFALLIFKEKISSDSDLLSIISLFGGHSRARCASDVCLQPTNKRRYILNKKKKLDVFYFPVISLFLRNPTFYGSIFIALVYMHHTHLFSTRLGFQIT